MDAIKLIGISGKAQVGKNTVAGIIQYLTAKEPFKVSLEKYLNSSWLHTSENNNWQVKSFAYKLKQVVSLLTGIPVGDLEKEEVKQMRLSDWVVWKLSWLDNYGGGIDLFSDEASALREQQKRIDEGCFYVGNEEVVPTVRSMLQVLGTDLLRNQLHPDVFCNALFADYEESYLNNTWYDDKDVYSVSEHDELLHPPEYPAWLISDTRFLNECQAIEQRGGIVIRVERLGLESTSTHRSETSLDNHVFAYTLFNDKDIPYLVGQVKTMLKQFKIPYNE